MNDIDITRLNDPEKTQMMLYSAHGKMSFKHITFWLDVLQRSTHRFSILVRDMKSFERLTELSPEVQVCYAKAAVDVETVIKTHTNLKIIYYTSHLSKNIHALRYNHVKHIFIGTQNSDWLFRFNKSYRAYDEFWAGGEFVVQRLQDAVENLGSLQPKVVGRPQAKALLTMPPSTRENGLILLNSSHKLEHILSLEGYRNNITNIYAYISPNKEEKFTEILQERFKAKHPNKELLPFDNKDIISMIFPDIAYIITDIKNLSPYFLLYGVPILIYVVNYTEREVATPHAMLDTVYFWQNPKELRIILDALGDGQDDLRQSREALCNHLFHLDATRDDLFITHFERVLKG